MRVTRYTKFGLGSVDCHQNISLRESTHSGQLIDDPIRFPPPIIERVTRVDTTSVGITLGVKVRKINCVCNACCHMLELDNDSNLFCLIYRSFDST